MSSDPIPSQLREPLVSPATKESDLVEKLTIDNMLQKYCGEFGPWQIRQFLITNLCWVLEALHTMVIIFADRQPEWRCLDSCDSASNNVCDLSPGSWEWVGGSGISTVAEWGLICGEKYKVGLAQSMFFVGSLIGAGIFGHLADSNFGRKRSLMVVCLLNTIFGISTAFSPSYWIYVLFRFLTGISKSGNGICAFVLATEPVGPSKRGSVGMSSFYFFSIGIAILSGVAYLFESWRKLYIVSTIPSFIFLVAILPFVYESPRWYLVHGKTDEAMKIMESIAKSNGKRIPDGVVLSLDKEAENKDDHDQQNPESGTLIDVLRSTITRKRLILMTIVCFLCAIVYYGLSLNVVNLGMNLYINVLLNAVIEVPAFITMSYLLNKVGRKGIGIGTFWFSGFFCLIGSFLKSKGNWKVVRMVCGVFGIFGMAGNYSLMLLYLAELFPTVVRNTAIGFTSQAAQLGAILAPLVVVLGESLPFLVFAVCGVVGGLTVIYLPETMNKPLYDTIAGLEEDERV